ncbi:MULTISPECIES: hypothetical protein [unclassified Microcoleus]|uniref:hypothetical protein n=1 Tax=unclassified Microcoleus TaxID=2642155 RepID=UPI002FD4A698
MGGLFGPTPTPHKKTHSLWNGHLARSGLFGHWCQLKLSARPADSPPAHPVVRQGLKSLSHSESPLKEDWEEEFLTLLIHAAHPIVR